MANVPIKREQVKYISFTILVTSIWSVSSFHLKFCCLQFENSSHIDPFCMKRATWLKLRNLFRDCLFWKRFIFQSIVFPVLRESESRKIENYFIKSGCFANFLSDDVNVSISKHVFHCYCSLQINVYIFCWCVKLITKTFSLSNVGCHVV
jgi:hypothetical protein